MVTHVCNPSTQFNTSLGYRAKPCLKNKYLLSTYAGQNRLIEGDEEIITKHPCPLS
jgi:hypothetical protein